MPSLNVFPVDSQPRSISDQKRYISNHINIFTVYTSAIILIANFFNSLDKFYFLKFEGVYVIEDGKKVVAFLPENPTARFRAAPTIASRAE